MQHNYILPFILSNDYLYKYGVADIKLVTLVNDVYVFIKYNIENIKNRKLFFYLLNKEKFLYNYYYEDLFVVKLKLDDFTSWYVKTIYYGGEKFISFHDLFDVFKKEIPAARESSRDLFFNHR